MKKFMYLALGLTMAAAAAWGAFGTVISSFASPGGPNPDALAYGGGYLYCMRDVGGGDLVYRLNPANGSVYSSFVSPAGNNGCGLAYYGGDIFNGDSNANRVFRTTTAGSVVSSFNVASVTGGLTEEGSYLWATGGNTFRRMTTTGSVVSSFTTSFTPLDPGFGGSVLFVGSGNPVHMIYKLSTNGSVLESVAPPVNWPRGCAFDGTYLWISTTANHTIYKMDAGNVYTAVVPASFGSVKVLYR
jgi:hypothetical protein